MGWNDISEESKQLAQQRSLVVQKRNEQNRIDAYNQNPKRCKRCDLALAYHEKKKIFCTRSCSAKFNNALNVRSVEWKEKIRQGMLRGIAEGRVRVPDGHKTDKLDKICLLCKTQFLVYPSESHRRYCSKKCASDDSASYRHNMGGYREGSGRRKSGYYKGLYCQSTYELCWAIYSLDHGVQFSRFPFMLESDTVKYFPDFLLADGKTIVELKGYEHTDAVARKTELAESLGYCVTVLRKDDLKIHFQYVKDTYGTSDFYTLYDGYKPKYDYVCDFCHEPFAVEKKRKALKVYCSNSCAGKAVGHRAQNTPLGSPTAVQ